jgi:hypothetical protein
VAYFSPAFGLMTEPRLVCLEEAADYHKLGYAVLVDPVSEIEFATWERSQRSRWFRRSVRRDL